MLDVLTLAREDTSLKRKSIREQSGSCPDSSCRCQHDGFNVKHNGECWVWMCRGRWDSEEYLPEKGRKRGWGDAIDYLRHYRGMSFQEAKRLVDDGETDETGSAPAPGPAVPERRDYTTEDWQAKTAQAMQDHMTRLWVDDAGLPALKYLHERRLYGEIVTWARLGYSLVGGIPRLVIPSINDGRYVAIHRRDLRPGVESPWKDAPGSAGDELYLADSLKRKLPTVLTEGPLDALSVLQEYGREGINAVATIGIGKCHEPKWLAKLARMPIVLVAFDADKPGDEAAVWWLERLPNARRLRPWLHDVNEMLIESWDLVSWIDDLLEKYVDLWLTQEAPLCATCLDAGQETPALPDAAEDDFGYCAQHHPARIVPEIHASAGQPRVIEGLSEAAYMAMLRQEAQEAQAHKLAAGEQHGKK